MLSVAFYPIDARRIFNLVIQSIRSILVEGIDQRFTVVIVVNPGTDTNRGPGIGGIGDCQARRKVILRLWPESRLAVRSACGLEVQIIFVDLTCLCGRLSLQKPSVGIDGGRYLLTTCLIWSLEDGVTHAKGGGREIWFHPPCILHVPFELIRFEMAVENGSIREKRTARGAGERVAGDIREPKELFQLQVRKRNLAGAPGNRHSLLGFQCR